MCKELTHMKNDGHPQQKGRQRCSKWTRADVGSEARELLLGGLGQNPMFNSNPCIYIDAAGSGDDLASCPQA